MAGKKTIIDEEPEVKQPEAQKTIIEASEDVEKSMKTTMSLEKETVEMVKKVKRKMSFDIDQDLTTNQTIVQLCQGYLNGHKDEVTEVEKGGEVNEQ